jgi:hypothetical protein
MFLVFGISLMNECHRPSRACSQDGMTVARTVCNGDMSMDGPEIRTMGILVGIRGQMRVVELDE